MPTLITVLVTGRTGESIVPRTGRGAVWASGRRSAGRAPSTNQ